MRAANALGSLRICAGLSEPSLPAYAIITKIPGLVLAHMLCSGVHVCHMREKMVVLLIAFLPECVTWYFPQGLAALGLFVV